MINFDLIELLITFDYNKLRRSNFWPNYVNKCYLWLVRSASSSASNWAVTGSHTTWPSTGHVGWECSSQLSIQSLWNCTHKDGVRFKYKFTMNLLTFFLSAIWLLIDFIECSSMVGKATFQLAQKTQKPNNFLHNINIYNIHSIAVSLFYLGTIAFKKVG